MRSPSTNKRAKSGMRRSASWQAVLVLPLVRRARPHEPMCRSPRATTVARLTARATERMATMVKAIPEKGAASVTSKAVSTACRLISAKRGC